MAGKKARGSWDSNDGRTKAGKSVSTYHPHKDFDAAVGIVGGLFKSTKKTAPKKERAVKSKKVSDDYGFDEASESSFDHKAHNEQMKSMKPLLIVLGIVGAAVSILFWIWVSSLF